MAPKKHILIVEDEADLRELVRQRLEWSNYVVSAAADGEEGLKKIYEENIDLIILDIMLPGVDGYEVMRTLKRNPRYSRIPILAFTAKGSKDSQEKILEAGADDYLVKPYEGNILLYKVKTLLERSKPWR